MDNASARQILRASLMVPEKVDIYKRQVEAFRAKFGREMGPDDPFFFDPDASVPQFRSPADADLALNFLAELMAQMGLDPAAIYAFRKTRGLFPTLPSMSKDELAEWNAALDEYHGLLRASGTH